MLNIRRNLCSNNAQPRRMRVIFANGGHALNLGPYGSVETVDDSNERPSKWDVQYERKI